MRESETPQTREVQRQKEKMRYMWHSELRTTLGFKGEESHYYMTIRADVLHLAVCPAIKVISDDPSLWARPLTQVLLES